MAAVWVSSDSDEDLPLLSQQLSNNDDMPTNLTEEEMAELFHHSIQVLGIPKQKTKSDSHMSVIDKCDDFEFIYDIQKLASDSIIRTIEIFDNTLITDVTLINIVKFAPNITSLILTRCSNLVCYEILSNLTNLESLKISGSDSFNNQALRGILQNNARLKTLSIKYCTGISNSAFDLDDFKMPPQTLVAIVPNITREKIKELNKKHKTDIEYVHTPIIDKNDKAKKLFEKYLGSVTLRFMMDYEPYPSFI